MTWCVRLFPNGAFKNASRTNGPGELAQIVFSVAGWAAADSEAAGQFTAPAKADAHRRAQEAFVSATGLDQSARMQSSMSDALRSFGGT